MHHHSSSARRQPTDMAEAAESENRSNLARGATSGAKTLGGPAGLLRYLGPHLWLFEQRGSQAASRTVLSRNYL